MIELPWLKPGSLDFPPVNTALEDPNGLLAFGGDLRVETLIAAYSKGIFPWFEQGQPILWWSPQPRMVLFPQKLHISKSLAKTLRRHEYEVRCDSDFPAVISACAASRRDLKAAGNPSEKENGDAETWITADMAAAYTTLHAQGYAHSVEVWCDQNLVGGLYGIAIGKVFFGESMFSREDNCSKIALVSLCKRLDSLGYQLVDCQVSSPHLSSLGAQEISREQFMNLLRENIDATHPSFSDNGNWSLQP